MGVYLQCYILYGAITPAVLLIVAQDKYSDTWCVYWSGWMSGLTLQNTDGDKHQETDG